MTVWVDELTSWGPGKACQMRADTADELMDMADRLGLKREWVRDHRHADERRWYFDLSPSRRQHAVRLGAKEETIAQMRARVGLSPAPSARPDNLGRVADDCFAESGER